MAAVAPVSLSDGKAPVTLVESTETTTQADGKATTVERRQTTTGASDAGGFLGWALPRVVVWVIQVAFGLLVAYLIAGLVHRAICGHYAMKMGPVELTDSGQAAPIESAARAASAAVDDRRVLAEDTKAAAAEVGEEGVRPSSEPVDEIDSDIGGGVEVVFGLRDLSVSLATVLRQLLSPPPRQQVGNADGMVKILSNRGVLPQDLATAVNRVLYQCRMIGAAPARAQIDDAAMVYGPRLLADLRALRGTAALAFERHVLRELEHVPRCTVEREVVFLRSQVDAVARRGGEQVVVEVRARVGPGATTAVEDVRTWLSSLPDDLPALLIIPAEPTPSRLWQQILERPHLTILVWDEQSGELASTLNRLLAAPGRAAVNAQRGPSS